MGLSLKDRFMQYCILVLACAVLIFLVVIVPLSSVRNSKVKEKDEILEVSNYLLDKFETVFSSSKLAGKVTIADKTTNVIPRSELEDLEYAYTVNALTDILDRLVSKEYIDLYEFSISLDGSEPTHLVVSKADYIRYNISDKVKVDLYKSDSNDSSINLDNVDVINLW